MTAAPRLIPCTGRDCGVLIDADEPGALTETKLLGPVAICLACQEQRGGRSIVFRVIYPEETDSPHV